ncbi:MAG: hypothetical protein AB1505_15045 [Candidatus Latescibacterota bacterium]
MGAWVGRVRLLDRQAGQWRGEEGLRLVVDFEQPSTVVIVGRSPESGERLFGPLWVRSSLGQVLSGEQCEDNGTECYRFSLGRDLGRVTGTVKRYVRDDPLGYFGRPDEWVFEVEKVKGPP